MHYIAFFLILISFVLATPPPLPGVDIGGTTYDPLTLEQGINVFDTNKKCLTPDSAFEVPCGLSVISILDTNTQMYSNVYTSTDAYTYSGTTAVSISADASFLGWGASAKYSQSTSEYISNSLSNDVTLIRSSADMTMYQLTLQPTVIQLSQELLNIVSFIYDAYLIGDTETVNTWMYQLCNSLKPGTVTSFITGASLQEFYYVDDTYFSSTETSTVTKSAEAKVTFGSIFSASGSYNSGATQTQIDDFTDAITESTFTVVGGQYIDGMTKAEWQTTAYASPATLQMTISPSNIFISPQVLFSHGFTNKSATQFIYDSYTASQSGYLVNNSYAGCTDMFATNFNLSASVGTDDCTYEAPNYSSFAGFYLNSAQCIDAPGFGLATCYGGFLETTNEDNQFTNQLSCPNGTYSNSFQFYSSGTSSYEFASLVTCYDFSFGGPALGGFYTSSTVNVITQGYNCPLGMQAVSYPQGVYVCQSYDPTVTSYPYGGSYIQISTSQCFGNVAFSLGCSCPPIAPNAFPLYSYDNIGNGEALATLYVCIGTVPQWVKSNNTGIVIPLNIMLPQTYNMTQTPCTAHVARTNNYWLTAVVTVGFVVLVTGAIIAIFFTYYITKRLTTARHLASYETVL